MQPSSTAAYVLCIRSGGSLASLETRKTCQRLPDAPADRQGLLRSIDESGEDCLHPADLFVPSKLASPALKALAKTEPHKKALKPTKPRPSCAEALRRAVSDACSASVHLAGFAAERRAAGQASETAHSRHALRPFGDAPEDAMNRVHRRP